VSCDRCDSYEAQNITQVSLTQILLRGLFLIVASGYFTIICALCSLLFTLSFLLSLFFAACFTFFAVHALPFPLVTQLWLTQTIPRLLFLVVASGYFKLSTPPTQSPSKYPTHNITNTFTLQHRYRYSKTPHRHAVTYAVTSAVTYAVTYAQPYLVMAATAVMGEGPLTVHNRERRGVGTPTTPLPAHSRSQALQCAHTAQITLTQPHTHTHSLTLPLSALSARGRCICPGIEQSVCAKHDGKL
jgi:hypothetical protein